MAVQDAKVFLLTSCILCAVVSLMTGSSWTTIATVGVALIGIGHAEGFSDAVTAGAIISGAYFGDKISPLMSFLMAVIGWKIIRRTSVQE